MDVCGQSVHITPKLILVVRRVEFGEADIQIEIIFGSERWPPVTGQKNPALLEFDRVYDIAAPVSRVHGHSQRSPALMVVGRVG